MKKHMPFDFLLDYLPANRTVKPAIGMCDIYFEVKIVLIFLMVAKIHGTMISDRCPKGGSCQPESNNSCHYQF
jgi:hypothetical protein